MNTWGSAFVFALTLVAFVIGLSCIIMSAIQPAGADAIKKRVEYGFFGVSGLVVSGLFVYVLS